MARKTRAKPLPYGRGAAKPVPHGRGAAKPLPHGRGSGALRLPKGTALPTADAPSPFDVHVSATGSVNVADVDLDPRPTVVHAAAMVVMMIVLDANNPLGNGSGRGAVRAHDDPVMPVELVPTPGTVMMMRLDDDPLPVVIAVVAAP